MGQAVSSGIHPRLRYAGISASRSHLSPKVSRTPRPSPRETLRLRASAFFFASAIEDGGQLHGHAHVAADLHLAGHYSGHGVEITGKELMEIL